MNAQDLWSGNDYALTSNISRGVNYYYNATRVKVLRVFPQKNGYSSQRATMMVDVIVCRNDGAPMEYNGVPRERTVRARDIFMRWDEYERETKYREEQKEQIAQREADAAAREQDKKNAIISGLESKGIDRLWISSVSDHSVNLSRRYIEEWLNLDES